MNLTQNSLRCGAGGEVGGQGISTSAVRRFRSGLCMQVRVRKQFAVRQTLCARCCPAFLPSRRSLGSHMATRAIATSPVLTPLQPSAVSWPPHLPLAGCEAGSFADGTINVRLPAIVAGMLSDMETVAAGASDPDYAAQLGAAASEIEGMRSELLSASTSLPADLVATGSCSADLAVCVTTTNEAMAAWRARLGPQVQPSWLALPWLLVECYMYVRIAVAIQKQPLLAASRFDPFHVQKLAAFEKSRGSIASMAAGVEQLLQRDVSEEGSLKEGLYQVTQYALWGNKTDLSLLVDASKIDPAALAAPSAASAGTPFLIVDEFDSVWELMKKGRTSGGKRQVDIILDNSGLELYSDLCLADVLLRYGLADEIVFHGKPFGWFVSDTTREDFTETLQLCTSPDPNGSEAWSTVQSLAGRWQAYMTEGRWRYTEHCFWVTPAPFCWMSQLAPGLHADFKANSMLMIFKGDLNYRKLTFDCRWPWTAPFSEALMGFGPVPLLSLRTLKADVIAGLKPGEGEALGKVDKDWQVNGKFGIIQAAV